MLVPSTVGAETTDEADHAQTVIDALLELGVPQEVIDDQFGDDIRRSVGSLIEAGLIDTDDVTALREDIREDRIAEAVEDRQARAEEHRQAHRANVAEVLDEYGVVLEEGQTVAEALEAAGVDREAVREEVRSRNEAERAERQAERQVERDERQAERAERQTERASERVEEQSERTEEREERQGEREAERAERAGERDRRNAPEAPSPDDPTPAPSLAPAPQEEPAAPAPAPAPQPSEDA